MRRDAGIGTFVVLLAGLQSTLWAWSPSAENNRGAEANVETDARMAARELVAMALAAEIAGDPGGRQLYLREALEQDPCNAEAHWQLGEVFVGQRWAPAGEACQLVASQKRRAEYRLRRTLFTSQPADQYDLALWCGRVGLTDEGRAHLASAWQDNPELMGSGETLGLTNRGGVWMTPEQLRADNLLRRRQRAALAKWKPRLERLRRNMLGSDSQASAAARRELMQLRDPEAVPAIEAVFSSGDQRQALLAVAMLTRIPGQQAASALVRSAVVSSLPEVRQAAAQALKTKSVYSYAPLLLSGLESPIEARLNDISQDGAMTLRLSLVREGPMADFELSEYLTTSPANAPRGAAWLRGGNTGAAREAAARQVNQVVAQVKEANARVKEVNDRFGAALATAADLDLSDRPREYWEWWYNLNDIYYPPERPVRRVEYTQPILFARVSECFAVGTPVWTIEGKQAIDQIRVGDCVLAQDVETGALAFKPVISTSLRPPSRLLNVRIGDETITVTRGHPMWVIGRGWRMAKELSAGDRVRSANGPIEVLSIEEGPEQVAYNLVVAEFNTYFAGGSKLLVHDNTIRRHTDLVLPGYNPDEPAEGEP